MPRKRAERGAEPPCEHAAELLANGLIDVHVELTPRGSRALAGGRLVVRKAEGRG